MKSSWRLALLLGSLAACAAREPAAPPGPPPPRAITPDRAAATARDLATQGRVTLIFTSDEHGWLLPQVDRARVRGGAAEALGQWVRDEDHCPGPLFPGDPEASLPAPRGCADPGTILLSGGDDFTGPAISTHFGGEPMARAMRRMGYAAAAFGNHELDFGRDRFASNRAAAGATWLAANLHAVDPARDLGVEPFHLFRRRGVTVGVVGLATDTTLRTAMASRFDGLAFEAEEPALDRAIPAAWAAGADAVVVVAHECPDRLEPVIARHPEWRLAFVGAGHCHVVDDRRVAGVPIVSPGWRLERYARVRIAVDRRRPAPDRVVSTEVAIVEVAHPAGAASPADAPLARDVDRYRGRVDAELGRPSGFARAAVSRGDPALARFLAGTWRASLGADVAVINTGGIRQGLPAGPITRATLLSILPFENQLVTCSITAAELAAELANGEAVAVGARLSAGRIVDNAGRPIPPERRLTVATIDFLYLGGAGFGFQRLDPRGRDTGVGWRAPVVAWLEAHPSTPSQPLALR